jgi:hypothetical protein
MAPNTRSEQLQLVSEGGVNLSLRMTDRSMNDIDVLDIDGRIVLGKESNAFREKVKGMLAAGKKGRSQPCKSCLCRQRRSGHPCGNFPQRPLTGRDSQDGRSRVAVQRRTASH